MLALLSKPSAKPSVKIQADNEPDKQQSLLETIDQKDQPENVVSLAGFKQNKKRDV